MPEDLAAKACEDCIPIVTTSQGRGALGDGVLVVVAVAHDPSCPWLARVAPESATVVSERGILIHAPQESGSVADDC